MSDRAYIQRSLHSCSIGYGSAQGVSDITQATTTAARRGPSMPTVPSVQRSCSPDAVGVSCISASASPSGQPESPGGYYVAGPTPDPEMDDLVLESVVTGDTAGPAGRDTEDNGTSVPPLSRQMTTRPRRLPSLSNLVLHSPSSIVGTPLDPTARFEYPFPSSSEISSSELESLFSPPLSYSAALTPGPSRFHSIPMPAVPLLTPTLSTAVFTSHPPVLSLPPFQISSSLPSRSHPPKSQTHPRLSPKSIEPPVPPRLAQKRERQRAAGAKANEQDGRSRGSSVSSSSAGPSSISSPQNSAYSEPLPVVDPDEKQRRFSFPV